MRHSTAWVPLLAIFLITALGCSGGEPEPETTTTITPPVDSHAGHSHEKEEAEAARAAEAAAKAAEQAAYEEKKKSGLGLEDEYVHLHKAARVTLSYDSETNSFKGIVENMGRDVMDEAHVKVALSNGQEIGPMTVRNIDPGGSGRIELKVEGGEFETWTVTPTVGAAAGEEEGEAAGFGDIGDIEDPNE